MAASIAGCKPCQAMLVISQYQPASLVISQYQPASLVISQYQPAPARIIGSAGCKPCQAMRHNFISIWIKYFYKWCV
jgi:hypothetical protein